MVATFFYTFDKFINVANMLKNVAEYYYIKLLIKTQHIFYASFYRIQSTRLTGLDHFRAVFCAEALRNNFLLGSGLAKFLQ